MNEEHPSLPDAPAGIVVAIGLVLTLVHPCPYCGRTHFHGGSKNGDPRNVFSGDSLISHCGNGSYFPTLKSAPAVFGNGAFRDPQSRADMERFQQMGIPIQLETVQLVV